MAAKNPKAPASVLLEASFSISLGDFRLAPEFNIGPELAVVFGPSGGGKSLTLQVIAGLAQPQIGRIYLDGVPLYDHQRRINLPPQDRRIGYVPQNYALFPHRSVAENIGYGLHELPASERRDQVRQLLGAMRLEGLEKRRPDQLSGGQQQRTALARALARRPHLLLLDEPFAAVEEDLRALLLAELVMVQQEFGIPMLLVTHNLSDAYSLADQLVVLDSGSVAQAGPREEVFRRPRNPNVARLVGMVNILQVEPSNFDGATLNARWNGANLDIASHRGKPDGGSLMVGVRPEEIRILGSSGERQATNRLDGVITRDSPRGADHMLAFQLEGGSLEVRVSHPEHLELGLALGQKRQLSILPTSFHVFMD